VSEQTLELALIGLPRPQIDEASRRLFGCGALGLQEDWLPGEAPAPRQPWDRGPAAPEPERCVLRAWFTSPDRDRVEAALAGLAAELAWTEVPERDWEAESRASFGPVEVVPAQVSPGEPGLVIAPPWDAPAGALVIEPGQGFGTGHHPTTVQALRAVWRLAGGHRSALDVGTGSGILAIAAAWRGVGRVEGIDVEAAAVRDAERNAVRNQAVASFTTRRIEAVTGTFDLVLANLHAELLVSLAPQLDRLTGRTLITAGILADREPMVRAALDGRLELVEREQGEGWVSLVHQRRAPG
jgi:ribosomal protein L11 methyltransferase